MHLQLKQFSQCYSTKQKYVISVTKRFQFTNYISGNLRNVIDDSKERVKISLVKILENIKLEKLLTITVNYKNSCQIFTKTKFTDVFYCLLLYFINFQENFLLTKKIIQSYILLNVSTPIKVFISEILF